MMTASALKPLVLVALLLLCPTARVAALARRHPDYRNFVELKRLEGHTKNVRDAVFNRAGTLLASASTDGTARLWNALSGSHLKTFGGDIFSEWDAEGKDGRKVRMRQPVGFRAVDFSPDERLLAVGCYDKTVRIWNITSGQIAASLENLEWNVDSVQFSRDGKNLLVAARHVYVFDVASWKNRRTVTLMGKSKSKGRPPSDWPMWPKGAFYSPDERLIATVLGQVVHASSSGVIRQPLYKLEGHKDYIHDIDWSPDGRMLVSGANDHKAIVWNALTGQPLRILSGHQSQVNSVHFSPLGGVVATGGQDNTACIWDIAVPRLIRKVERIPCGVYVVRFTPNGKKLLTASGEGFMQIWGERR